VGGRRALRRSHVPPTTAAPNLEYLKKQAKELFTERAPSHPEWTLAAAQHALAREYGFESSPR
jgi:hypothetical protein